MRNFGNGDFISLNQIICDTFDACRYISKMITMNVFEQQMNAFGIDLGISNWSFNHYNDDSIFALCNLNDDATQAMILKKQQLSQELFYDFKSVLPKFPRLQSPLIKTWFNNNNISKYYQLFNLFNYLCCTPSSKYMMFDGVDSTHKYFDYLNNVFSQLNKFSNFILTYVTSVYIHIHLCLTTIFWWFVVFLVPI